MTNKKNKFFTFCFSLIPGAGEMYLGFYKMGISLMSLFFALTAICGILNLPAALFLTPIIWFYSFFHVQNLNALPDEEFYALEDDWLFHLDADGKGIDHWIRKYRKSLSALLIFFGFSLLWTTLSSFAFRFFDFFNISREAWNLLRNITNMIPQLVIAIIIILFGIHLIREKKESLDQDEDPLIPSPPYVEYRVIHTETPASETDEAKS